MAEPIRDFLMDASGDLAAVQGDFATVGGADAVPQGIQIRVNTFLKEIFLDESEGVDWLGTILVKGSNPVVDRELIAEAILDTPDVTGVVGTELQITADRQGFVDYSAATVYSKNPVIGQVAVT